MSAIVLLPLGDTNLEIVAEVQDAVRETFQSRTLLLEPIPDMRPFYDAQRSQYNSTDILRYVKEQYTRHHLRSRGSRHAKTFLAITANDLFIPVLTYVFGEAELNGDVAVASYFRLQNEIYGLPRNRPLLVERLKKEAIHELGHTFGLVHCMSTECVMHTSTYVEDIDVKGGEFCDACSASILHERKI